MKNNNSKMKNSNKNNLSNNPQKKNCKIQRNKFCSNIIKKVLKDNQQVINYFLI